LFYISLPTASNWGWDLGTKKVGLSPHLRFSRYGRRVVSYVSTFVVRRLPPIPNNPSNPTRPMRPHHPEPPPPPVVPVVVVPPVVVVVPAAGEAAGDATVVVVVVVLEPEAGLATGLAAGLA
jgi:hypothetical protein